MKAALDGNIIHGQGARPKLVKYNSEPVLAFTRVKRGRPLPILDEGMSQLVGEWELLYEEFMFPEPLALPRPRPHNKHSSKPEDVQDRIERLHGPQTRLELFARRERPGWDSWGLGVGSEPWLEELTQLEVHTLSACARHHAW